MNFGAFLGYILIAVVYAGMMYIGRVLKRRWGVKLGGDYQMLCIANGFFVGTS